MREDGNEEDEEGWRRKEKKLVERMKKISMLYYKETPGDRLKDSTVGTGQLNADW